MSGDARPTGFIDTNGDGFVSAIDGPLSIINYLNKQSKLAAAPPAAPPAPVPAAIPPAAADAALAAPWSFTQAATNKARSSRVTNFDWTFYDDSKE